MPDWASPSEPSRCWQRLRPRALTMAISLRCSTRRAIAARSLSRSKALGPRASRPRCPSLPSPACGGGREGRRDAHGPRSSLQTQRHEAKFPIRVRDQKEHRPAAVLLELLDPLLQRIRIADSLLRDFDHYVARTEPLVGGGGLGFDAGDHDALHAVLDLVTLAQVVGHVSEVEAKRLLYDSLFLGRRLLVGGQRRLLLAVFKTPELHGAALFLTLSYDENVDFLADRRIGDDTRQVFHLPDVLAVEPNDDIPGFDAGRLRRPLVVDAGHQRAAGRLDVETIGNIVGHLLDAHAQPAAPRFAELAELVDN